MACTTTPGRRCRSPWTTPTASTRTTIAIPSSRRCARRFASRVSPRSCGCGRNSPRPASRRPSASEYPRPRPTTDIPTPIIRMSSTCCTRARYFRSSAKTPSGPVSQKDGSFPRDTPYQWIPMSLAGPWWDRIIWPTLEMTARLGFDRIWSTAALPACRGSITRRCTSARQMARWPWRALLVAMVANPAPRGHPHLRRVHDRIQGRQCLGGRQRRQLLCLDVSNGNVPWRRQAA